MDSGQGRSTRMADNCPAVSQSMPRISNGKRAECGGAAWPGENELR